MSGYPQHVAATRPRRQGWQVICCPRFRFRRISIHQVACPKLAKHIIWTVDHCFQRQLDKPITSMYRKKNQRTTLNRIGKIFSFWYCVQKVSRLWMWPGDLTLRLSAHLGMKCLNTKHAFVKSQKFFRITIFCTQLDLMSWKTLKICYDSKWIFPVFKNFLKIQGQKHIYSDWGYFWGWFNQAKHAKYLQFEWFLLLTAFFLRHGRDAEESIIRIVHHAEKLDLVLRILKAVVFNMGPFCPPQGPFCHVWR